MISEVYIDPDYVQYDRHIVQWVARMLFQKIDTPIVEIHLFDTDALDDLTVCNMEE